MGVEATKKIVDYWNKHGRLELATGLEGLFFMQKANAAHFKNREAEEAYVREKVWGQAGSASGDLAATAPSQESQDMSTMTVLGDYNNPPAVVYPPASPPPPPQKSNTLAAAALGLSTLLGGGAVGYLLADKNPPQVERVIENSGGEVELGLGRIEDYQPNRLNQ